MHLLKAPFQAPISDLSSRNNSMSNLCAMRKRWILFFTFAVRASLVEKCRVKSLDCCSDRSFTDNHARDIAEIVSYLETNFWTFTNAQGKTRAIHGMAAKIYQSIRIPYTVIYYDIYIIIFVGINFFLLLRARDASMQVMSSPLRDHTLNRVMPARTDSRLRLLRKRA